MGAYLKRTVRCGRLVEVEKYYAAGWGAGHGSCRRAPKTAATPEDMRRVNERNARRRLRWLINANFGRGDLHVTLTYRKDERPEDPAELRQRLGVFLRKARALARRSGTELRYIHVTEYASTAPHHHVILHGLTLQQLEALWPWGRVRASALDAGPDYGSLAAYLVKETSRTFREPDHPYGRRWCASRNLVQPEIRTEVVHAESWRKAPKAIKGYILVPDSVEVGVHEVTGAPWQRYWMRRIE